VDDGEDDIFDVVGEGAVIVESLSGVSVDAGQK
jgi:hypothetical protein